ncbi:MAG: ATP-binding cassette domain-containing protein [Elusimicrobia bacterium]|nr:ATP-binding cassette domain-containing protein [Elusimicrobiota bacterium]
MIRLADVHRSFGMNHVLRGATLEAQDGETLTIIGGSGSGKSVTLKLIVGLLRPDQGRIWVDDVVITNLPEDKLFEVQKKFGFLFQGAALFDSLTVEENILFGVKNLRPDLMRSGSSIAVNKLALVGLKPEVARLKPAELSGGMKKRVGLARAIAHEPLYILYDEPTTGLDPIMSDVINDLILELQQKLKVTSVVVTHDMKSAYKVSNRIAMLYEGKIVAVNTPEEIQATDNPLVKQFVTGSSRGPIQMPVRAFS